MRYSGPSIIWTPLAKVVGKPCRISEKSEIMGHMCLPVAVNRARRASCCEQGKGGGRVVRQGSKGGYISLSLFVPPPNTRFLENCSVVAIGRCLSSL